VIELSHAADSRWKEEKMIADVHTNWEIVDKDVFWEMRLWDAKHVAIAFVDEAFKDVPDENRINSLAEIGQSRFSVNETRGNRMQLFMIFVNDVVAQRKAI
jgi:hypothetical protein